MILLVLFFGLVIGSFISAWSYRLPREISISKGRSVCPHCGEVIYWYDNIPLFSFLMLKGVCRACKNPISKRYPIIEASTGITFVAVYLAQPLLASLFPFVDYLLLLPLSLSIAGLLLTIFVVDVEEQIIPDTAVFLMIILVLGTLLFSANNDFWIRLATGFLMSWLLLSLNLVTKGRGMGLGDVKLVIPLGMILGFPTSISFMFFSFAVGALYGVILIALSLKNLKSKVAFGPFLIIGFVLALLVGTTFTSYVLPLS